MADLICWCFGYTAQDILHDIAKNGSSLIMEKISEEKRALGGATAPTRIRRAGDACPMSAGWRAPVRESRSRIEGADYSPTSEGFFRFPIVPSPAAGRRSLGEPFWKIPVEHKAIEPNDF